MKSIPKYIKQSAKKILQFVLPQRAFMSLMMYRQRRDLRAFTSKIVIHKYGNNTFKVRVADPLAKNWYDKDWEELHEIIKLRDYSLKAGARVFNVGAHQCVVAMMLAAEVGPSGQVVALEANPHNAKIGAENRDLNNLKQLVVINQAIGEKAGELKFNEDLNGQVDQSGGKIVVTARTIDSLTSEYGKPSVVTIDVEGFECAALRGASRTIAESKPDFFIEVHVNAGLEQLGGSVREVISYLSAKQYDFLITRPESGEFIKTDFTKDESFENDIVKDRFYLLALRRR